MGAVLIESCVLVGWEPPSSSSSLESDEDEVLPSEDDVEDAEDDEEEEEDEDDDDEESMEITSSLSPSLSISSRSKLMEESNVGSSGARDAVANSTWSDV